MKKGCFLTSIFVLTILIAAIYYVFQNYGDELWSFGKRKISELVASGFEEEINGLNEGKYKDSLKTLVKDFARLSSEKSGQDFETTVSNFVDSVKIYIRDATLDSLEYSKLKKIAYYNEKPKKD